MVSINCVNIRTLCTNTQIHQYKNTNCLKDPTFAISNMTFLWSFFPHGTWHIPLCHVTFYILHFTFYILHSIFYILHFTKRLGVLGLAIFPSLLFQLDLMYWEVLVVGLRHCSPHAPRLREAITYKIDQHHWGKEGGFLSSSLEFSEDLFLVPRYCLALWFCDHKRNLLHRFWQYRSHQLSRQQVSSFTWVTSVKWGENTI